MKRSAIAGFVAMSMLLFMATIATADDTGANPSRPLTFVTDSAVTIRIKARLAADQLTSLGRITVATDKDGDVWLSGTARTQEAVDQAVSLARGTEGVKRVHSDLKVRKDG